MKEAGRYLSSVNRYWHGGLLGLCACVLLQACASGERVVGKAPGQKNEHAYRAHGEARAGSNREQKRIGAPMQSTAEISAYQGCDGASQDNVMLSHHLT